MGYPIRDRDTGGRRPFRPDFNRDRGVRRPEMHKAICSSCGKECDLPFKPTGDRPVYCRDCFAKNGGGRNDNDRRDSRDNRDFPRPPFKPFTTDPRGPRPEPHAHPRPAPHDEQFAAINAKLDRLIQLLTPRPEPQPETGKTAIVEKTPKTKKEKVTKKKKVVKKELTTPAS